MISALVSCSAAIAEEGDIKQYVLELKGQYGEPTEVEIEKEPEDDLEPVRRPRRCVCVCLFVGLHVVHF